MTDAIRDRHPSIEPLWIASRGTEPLRCDLRPRESGVELRMIHGQTVAVTLWVPTRDQALAASREWVASSQLSGWCVTVSTP